MSVLDRVHDVISEKNLLKHPFYVAWTQGKLTIPMLREYAKQYYHHEAAFPRYLSQIHTNCPDISVRQVILDNMRDEEMSDKNHPALWLQFAKALGLSRQDVVDTAPLPETLATVTIFRSLAKEETAEALAAMYAYEYQVPDVARIKIEGLKKWYGISAPEDIEFFTVHQEADVWHSEAERNVFTKAATTKESEGRIVASVSRACDALNMLLDGVYRRFCQEALEPCCGARRK